MANSWLKVSTISFIGIFGAIPISAHEMEISEDVGATFHIEPNDTAKAGEPAQVWIALTRAGGAAIPLDKCDCQLAIYTQPRSLNSESKPVLQPVLKPLSTEGYKNIPSSTVTFPKIGSYDLEITGKPIGGEDFKPFKLNFKTTVTTAIAQVPNTKVKETKPAPTEFPLVPIMAAIGIISLGSTIFILKQSKPKP